MNRDLPINKLSWLRTHNAFNSAAEINADAAKAGGTNQNHSILDQLNAGVRVFMIDVHEFQDAPRVCHDLAGATIYEDLCDLLIKFKRWLSDEKNRQEILILMMEVAGDVPAEWIRNTFKGRGPITRPGEDYDLAALLYAHPAVNDPWPTINELCTAGTRIVVFRETDEGKGNITAHGMDWYHDMWAYWMETPYGNSNWTDLQEHTYQLLRGHPGTAQFFNLNHFVNTGNTGAGSAGFAQGMNRHDYLMARAIIAWRMHGRRPVLSVDFFRSLDDAAKEDTYNTIDTANALNKIPCISGHILDQQGHPMHAELIPLVIRWEGIEDIAFKSNGITDYRYKSDADAPADAHPTTFSNAFNFPSNGPVSGKYKSMVLKPTFVPAASAYVFEPESYTWDGKNDAAVDFKMKKI